MRLSHTLRVRLLFLAIVVPSSGPGQVPVSMPVARISGAVYDSVAGRHLAGAVVQLVQRDNPTISHSRTTDALGRFSFDSVAFSSYVIGFFHGAVDALGMESPLLAVEIRSQGEVRAMLATPSRKTIITQACGDSTARSRGLWIGSV